MQEVPPLIAEIVEGAPDRDRLRAWIDEALTHRTYVNEHPQLGAHDNQRLELLGDAVLELIVTRALFDALPTADEGLLSRARASVVNEAALATAARSLGIGASLKLGRGEVSSGGRDRTRTLADALEALIAALYLGAGIDAAAKLVEATIGPALRVAVDQAASAHDAKVGIDARVKDAKSVLQELVQREGAEPPSYELEQTEGPVHDRVFRVRVIARGKVLGRGEGRSRREAEMRAAAAAVDEVRRDDGEPAEGEPSAS